MGLAKAAQGNGKAGQSGGFNQVASAGAVANGQSGAQNSSEGGNIQGNSGKSLQEIEQMNVEASATEESSGAARTQQGMALGPVVARLSRKRRLT